MAEVLGVGASIIAIVQLTDRIIGLCKFYIEAAKDANSHLRAILIEIASLKPIFESLKFLTECNGGGADSTRAMSGVHGPLEGCRRSLTELEALLPHTPVESSEEKASRKEKMKMATSVLAWPFKEDRARRLLQEIAQYKATIVLALTTDSAQDIRDIKARTSDVHDILTESQRREVFQWLRHTSPSDIHDRARKDYEPGTGEWVSRCPEWSQLLEAKCRCVWLHGAIGAGKTILMSHLAEQLREHCKAHEPQKTISVWYYCYFGHNQDETEPFLKWLISELCQNAEYLPVNLRGLYSSNKTPILSDLLDILADALSEYDMVYITLDAIDESHQRESLLHILQTMSTDPRFRKLHIIASSREYADIERAMKNFSVSLSMDNDSVEQDIKLYVGSVLSKHSHFRNWPSSTLEEVKETLSRGAQGMFRWAVCQIDILQRLKCQPETIRQKMRELPKTLNETYERIFLDIPVEERIFVHHVLQWIILHNRFNRGEGIPAKVVIDAVEASILEITGRSNDRYYDMNNLQDFCGCLVRVNRNSLDAENSSDADSSPNGSLSLAHYTVREYLEFLGQSSTGTDYIRDIGRSLDKELIELVLTVSQRKGSYNQTDFDNAVQSSSDAWEFSQRNFGIYCAVSAILFLQELAVQLSENSTDQPMADDQLQNLFMQILHPQCVHFQTIQMMLSVPGYEVEKNLFLGTCSQIRGLIWSMKWSPTNVVEIQHIFNLMCQWYLPDTISTKILRDAKFEELVNEEIGFSIRRAEKDFKGTFVEGLSLMSCIELLSSMPLQYVLGHGIKLSDPSKVLLYSIGDHQCGFTMLQELLDSGANPDPQTYHVTPLQIAAARGDYEGMKILLEAGANPNGCGNPGSMAWEDTDYISRLNHLHGQSPLYIVKVLRPPYLFLSNLDQYEDCEALLLQYGASAFKTTE